MRDVVTLRQVLTKRLDDASSLRNAYPAFSVIFALIGPRLPHALASFVHCNAVISGKTAIKRRATPVKSTRKRKRSETVPRCGIYAT
ncbi:hypothetical protein [Bradyrhizobium sp. ORS 86]|uniref:hypothetical protein n=1 Tax=Bradyrhizobium sp. ORS 86 TaxID=1685970 RepID=UPI00388FD7CE